MESKEEDPDWTEAQKILGADLTGGNFKTWIAPLIFERNASEVILRCPNQFFMNWVKTRFAAQTNSALNSRGLPSQGIIHKSLHRRSSSLELTANWA